MVSGKGRLRPIVVGLFLLVAVPSLVNLTGMSAAAGRCSEADAPSSMVSIDIASGQVDQLSDLAGYDTAIWSATEHRGWVTFTSQNCNSIAPIDGRGIRPLPTLEPRPVSLWKLEGDFTDPKNCAQRGLIIDPRAEPTMDRILALAAPGAIGAPTTAARLSKPRQVYELDLTAHWARLIGGDFTDPEGFSVAAGKAVVSATQQGVFQLNLADGTSTSLGAPAVSPDGKKVAVVDYSDEKVRAVK